MENQKLDGIINTALAVATRKGYCVNFNSLEYGPGVALSCGCYFLEKEKELILCCSKHSGGYCGNTDS